MRPPTTLPLVTGPWQPLSADESAEFIARLDLHLLAGGMNPPLTRSCRIVDLRAVPLSFYPGWLLVEGEAELEDAQVGTFDVLMGPGFLWCLDGRSAVIHALNRGTLPMGRGAAGDAPDDAFAPEPLLASPLAPLADPKRGGDYLRFFCNGVRGEVGSFRVVESVADLLLCGAAPDPALGGLPIQSLRVFAADRAEATLLYNGQLFVATFSMDADGLVSMDDETQLAADVAPCEVTRGVLRHVRARAPLSVTP